METPEVFPYYHPTTVVFIDDNMDFLGNLSLQLDANLAYRMFDSPSKALSHLNNTALAKPLSKRFFAADENVDNMHSDTVLRMDVAAIEREIYNNQRFAEPSVVMVDYSMPNMSGIELCQRIENPHVKKILFTGVADERVAVKAFNDGLIDRFILKSERDVYEAVNQSIQALQHAYIRDTVYAVKHALGMGVHGFLMDPAFERFFHQLCDKNAFVEYYFSADPAGFVLLDSHGCAARLLLLSDEDLRVHWQIAHDQNAPAELLRSLESGEFVPYFEDSADGYYKRESSSWRQYLHSARRVDGKQTYYCALINDSLPLHGEAISSFTAYLDWLDSTGYALI